MLRVRPSLVYRHRSVRGIVIVRGPWGNPAGSSRSAVAAVYVSAAEKCDTANPETPQSGYRQQEGHQLAPQTFCTIGPADRRRLSPDPPAGGFSGTMTQNLDSEVESSEDGFGGTSTQGAKSRNAALAEMPCSSL